MKSVVPFVLLSCFIFFSCKKNTSKVCHDPITQAPCFVSLTGRYTSAEIDTVVLNRYAVGSGQLISSDTTFTKAYTFRGDTCITQTNTTANGYFSFGSLKRGEDYRLIIPGTSRQYSISGVKYNDSSTLVNYVTSGSCGGRSFKMPPDSVRVDNREMRTMPGDPGTSYIFLPR